MAGATFLIVVLAFYTLVAITLGLLAGALAQRFAPDGRLAGAIRSGVPMFLGAFAAVMLGWTAFGTASHPDSQAKLATLDRGVYELLACAPVAAIATVVGLAAALYFAIRQLRRATTSADGS